MSASATASPARVRLRTVAVPNEHGAWGFWLEPALLALVVVPSSAGALLALAGLVAVFAQHPLSLLLADRARGRTYPRTLLARRVLLVHVVLGGSLVATALACGSPAALAPLLLAAPFALLQLRYERRNRGRDLVPELAGPVALAALAGAIVLAGGGTPALAVIMWALLVARNVPTVLYVRARLRLERAGVEDRAVGAAVPAGAAVAVAAAAAALLLAAAAAWLDLAPGVAMTVYLALLARAALGVSPWRRPAGARAIGIREMLYGVAAALTLALAWAPSVG